MLNYNDIKSCEIRRSDYARITNLWVKSLK